MVFLYVELLLFGEPNFGTRLLKLKYDEERVFITHSDDFEARPHGVHV